MVVVVQYMGPKNYGLYGPIVEAEHIETLCAVVQNLGQNDALIYELMAERDSIDKRKRYCKAGVESSSFPN